MTITNNARTTSATIQQLSHEQLVALVSTTLDPTTGTGPTRAF